MQDTHHQDLPTNEIVHQMAIEPELSQRFTLAEVSNMCTNVVGQIAGNTSSQLWSKDNCVSLNSSFIAGGISLADTDTPNFAGFPNSGSLAAHGCNNVWPYAAQPNSDFGAPSLGNDLPLFNPALISDINNPLCYPAITNTEYLDFNPLYFAQDSNISFGQYSMAFPANDTPALPDGFASSLEQGSTIAIGDPIAISEVQVECIFACGKFFKRDYERVRHEQSVHLHTPGLHLCPISGCKKSTGKGWKRNDKVTEHLWKAHGDLGYARRA